VNCTIYGGIVCCSPWHKHLAQEQSIHNHKSFKAARGRGCASDCGHLALRLSCLGFEAIPASCLPNQASKVCWQDPLMLGQASKPSCLGSGRKPQTQNKHSWVLPRTHPPTLLAHDNKGPTPKCFWVQTETRPLTPLGPHSKPTPNPLGS